MERESRQWKQHTKSLDACLFPCCIVCPSGPQGSFLKKVEENWRSQKRTQEVLCPGHVNLWPEEAEGQTQSFLYSFSFFLGSYRCFKTGNYHRNHVPPTVTHANPPFNQNGKKFLILKTIMLAHSLVNYIKHLTYATLLATWNHSLQLASLDPWAWKLLQASEGRVLPNPLMGPCGPSQTPFTSSPWHCGLPDTAADTPHCYHAVTCSPELSGAQRVQGLEVPLVSPQLHCGWQGHLWAPCPPLAVLFLWGNAFSFVDNFFGKLLCSQVKICLSSLVSWR